MNDIRGITKCFPRGERAFTLVELMIVVMIIGILMIMAVPAWQRFRIRAQDTKFINEIRLVSQNTFEMYALKQGDYPPDELPGVTPTNVVNLLPRRFRWEDGPAIGGVWDWNRGVDRSTPVFGYYAGIAVNGPARTTTEMTEIDKRMDDGSLFTGRFQQRPGGYVLILE